MTHLNSNWVLLTIFLFFNLSFTSYSQKNANDAPLQKAPDFTLKDLSGKEVSMNEYKEKFLVIHIATTWCPFCNAEAPYLQALYEKYQSENVEVLIIDVKEPESLVKSKLQNKYNFTFPVLLDSDGNVAASFAPENVLPDLARDEVMLASNLIVDPEGNIQFMSLLDSKNFDAKLISLQKRLNELLQEN
ncbi:peroxiredoxin family protein [Mangrovivirga sp. M17]|uniref:Peroxiredoxin family protein n=1 Tax=Mangrovivirga halotolerans TaxID=2993936 RepID=A0ABT3RN44_9BACT|nr:peroxiredoxin family protein [Mangrovivirga halotolerans]MCX2742794.1 peroxiredoxin family protein [Mangrovivirga halotolerans]